MPPDYSMIPSSPPHSENHIPSAPISIYEERYIEKPDQITDKVMKETKKITRSIMSIKSHCSNNHNKNEENCNTSMQTMNKNMNYNDSQNIVDTTAYSSNNYYSQEYNDNDIKFIDHTNNYNNNNNNYNNNNNIKNNNFNDNNIKINNFQDNNNFNNLNNNNENINKNIFESFENMFISYFLKNEHPMDFSLYDYNEINSIINLTLNYIYNFIQKNNNLTNENKKEINILMEKFLTNIIKPLLNDNTDVKILRNMVKKIFDKKLFEQIFKINEPIFEEKIVEHFYNLLLKFMDILYFKDNNKFSEILDAVIEFYKKIRIPNYNGKGKNESNLIKFIYNILYKTIENMQILANKCIKNNLISLLISGIENEHPLNYEIIFKILKIIIKNTEDYNKKLFPNDVKEKYDDDSKEEFLNKSLIKQLFLKNNINQLFFDNDRNLLNILIKIFQNEDRQFTYKYNLFCLPYLMEYSIKNKKSVVLFLEFCYNIIDIKDKYCLERIKQILGIPTLIIKPKSQINQKWPLFGAELIKNNNKDLKTKIYKYISLYKMKFCILSYLLPYEEENENENNDNILLDLEKRKTLIYQLITKILKDGGNYYIFKYLYLLPARSLSYNNSYEELNSYIKDNTLFKLDDLKNVEETFIKKINYELNDLLIKKNPDNKDIQKIDEPEIPEEIKENNPYNEKINKFIGFIPDFLPGQIVKEEIQLIAKTDNLQIIRIEYFTKFYNIKEINNIINEDIEEEEINNNKNINNDEIIDENEKVIKVGVLNENYQRNENKLMNIISKKLENTNKLIIEDRTISNEENVINSVITYIFINNKPIKNKIYANVKLNNNLNIEIKDNMCYNESLFDFVDRHNFVDFLDINRIQKDEKFIQKDDLYITVSSKAYKNKI